MILLFHFLQVPNIQEEKEAKPSNHFNLPPEEQHAILPDPGLLTTARQKRIYGLYGVAEKMMSERHHADYLTKSERHRTDCMEAGVQDAPRSHEAPL